MSEYLSGAAILMVVLSPLFIPIAVTIIDAVRRWSSLAATPPERIEVGRLMTFGRSLLRPPATGRQSDT